MAKDLLEQIMAEVQALEELLERARGVERGANEVTNFVIETSDASLKLVENIQSLIAELR